MKANELRIGNLLNSEVGIVRVESILGSVYRAYCHSLDEDYLADYALKDLSPIPLTKEWLLKFGFKNSEAKSAKPWIFYPSFELDYAIQKVRIHLICGIAIIWGRDIECKYVHQLQNLYFILTGKELLDIEAQPQKVKQQQTKHK